ncbi:Alpha/Beta hydrolase protein, partial [Hysterangium stoloniferum]
EGPYMLYDDPQGPECTLLFSTALICQRIRWFICTPVVYLVPAQLYCNNQMFAPILNLGLNPYGVRHTCNMKKDSSCYKDRGMYPVKLTLGLLCLTFFSPCWFSDCNIELNLTFMLQGDSVHNVAELLVPLLNKGVRLLVYAGKAGITQPRWSPFAEAFKKMQTSKWVTLSSGKEAGDVHSVGTNYTFVVVNEVGHMVPFDQSEAAADLIVRWIDSIPLMWVNSTVV